MENTTENNRLIAEFMGGKMVVENHHGVNIIEMPDGMHDIVGLKYHTSWDWLMPVIDQIQKVTEEPEELDALKDTLWWGDIEHVHEDVVDIIKRINSGEIETVKQ